VSRSAAETWSLNRSLAFLAAIFAITFGSLLPTGVAASSALGQPIMLCSGDAMMVVYDADGHPQPVKDTDLGSLSCASALLSALAAIDVPPTAVPLPAASVWVRPAPVAITTGNLARRLAPRPPSTAPPHA
jgi:hypothetical protein